MSYSRFAGSLDIEIGRSPVLGGLLIVAHAGAAVFALAVQIPSVVGWFALAAVALSLWHTMRRYVRLTEPAAITRVVVDAGGDWRLFFRDGTERNARLLSSSCLHPRVAVLNLKVSGRRFTRTVILLPDNIDASLFRRLRVRLLVGTAESRQPDRGSRLSGLGR